MKKELKVLITMILVLTMIFTSTGVTRFASVLAEGPKTEASEEKADKAKSEEKKEEKKEDKKEEKKEEKKDEKESDKQSDSQDKTEAKEDKTEKKTEAKEGSSEEKSSEAKATEEKKSDSDDKKADEKTTASEKKEDTTEKSDEKADEKKTEAAPETTTAKEKDTDESAAKIKLTAEAKYKDAFDEKEYVIKGHESDTIKLSDKEDIDSYAKDIDGYKYTGEAQIGDKSVKKIKKDKEGNVSYSTGGDDFTELKEDTKITFIYEQKFEKKKYEFENGSVKVTAILSDAEAIPDDAELKVTPVTKNSSDYNYDAYMGALNDKAGENGKKYTDDNTLLYDIAFVRDGKEIEPAKGTVSVKMTFKDKQLTDDLGVKESDDLTVKHLPVKGSVDKDSDDNSLSKNDINVENVQNTNVNASSETASFKTESFSLYAFTVDFTYDGYTFSIPGNGEILLSELFAQLKIEEDVANVESAVFSNEELVSVEKTEENDWLLKSLKPFNTEETLTVTMLNGTKYIITVTDAQDALTVAVSLYDYDDSTQVAFPPDFADDDIYAFIWVGEDTSTVAGLSDNTPWACVPLNDLKGAPSPKTFDVSLFNTQPWGGNEKAYSALMADEQSALKVRIIHKSGDAPTLGGLKNMAQYQQSDFEKIWNGGFDGYAMSKNQRSGLISPGNYEVNFIKGNKLEHDVVLEFDPASDKGPIPGGKSYVLLDATSADGNNHYYYVVEATTDGSQDKVYLPMNGNWSSNQPFSNNWQNITASVITPKPGKTLTPGGIQPNTDDYTTAYVMGDYFYQYIERTSETDEQAHIQRDEYVFKLKKASYEDAITPEEILGEAAEFGIVADTYKQSGHSETNYAVKNLDHNANTDVCGSGTGSMPFYVSNITGTSLDIHLTSCPIDLFLPEDQDSKLAQPHINDLKNSTFSEPEEIAGEQKLTEYHKSHNEIENYVDSLIAYGKQSSTTMASKTTVAPVLSGNNKTVDTTQFPDGKTIYVDCTNCKDIIGNSGWIINKLPNQSIVFNIPGENVSIGEFHVNVYDENGNKIDETGSTTDARDDGTSEKNRKVDQIIFDHISFNAYEAKSLDLNNASALFLAPEAETVTQSNGAGWILAKGTVDSHAEWHFYRHNRHYKAKGDFALAGQKKIVGTGKDYSEFSSLTFKFDLYECNDEGKIAEGATPIETVTADETGNFAFNKLKYTHQEVPEDTTQTFYYVVKEQVPEGGSEGGVKYDAKPVYIKVVATDSEGSGQIGFEISKATEFGTWSTPITPTGDDDNKIYAIGDFENSVQNGSLKVKKLVNGDNAKNDQYKIAVKNSDDHYFNVDGTDKGTTAFYVTFAKDQEQTWSNLPAGTYTVEEEDASVEGYSWAVSGTGDVAVEAGETATADVTNAYDNVKAEIKAEKNFTGRNWKSGDSFEFTLKPVDGAPMPSDATTVDGTKQKKMTVESENATTVTFGEITYTEEGTYKYTVTETKGNLPGVTYDTDPHEVTVTVEKNDDGKLTATVKYTKGTKAEEITNKFESVKAKPEVTKSITNWGTAESFTFTLAAQTPTDAPMPKGDGNVATATKTKTLAQFGEIEYTEPGTYIYKIKEADDHVPGITYDTSDHIVTVKVTQDSETNALSTNITYGTGEDAADKLTITNTFAGVKAKLEAEKAINEWGSAESFTFDLTAKDNAPMPDGTVDGKKSVTVTKESSSMKAVFGEIEYDHVGTYEYTIKEVDDKVPGVTYDSAEHTVVVTVSKATDSNAFVAEVKYDGKESLTITNQYASTNVELKATKKISYWGDEETFTFSLAAVDGAPMPEGSKDGVKTATATKAAPTAVFGSVKYETAGTYNYTITEEPGDAPGVTYDTTPHNVVVTVAKNDKGELVASAKYDREESLTITNTFTSVKAQPEVTKEIENWGKATSFTFNLEAVTDGAPMPEGTEEGKKSATVTKGQTDLKAVFGEIEFKKVGEYKYTITEVNDHVDGVTYDTDPHDVLIKVTKNAKTNALEAEVKYDGKESLIITNTFAAAKAELKAEKEFENWGKADSFTFTLAAVKAEDTEGNAITPVPVPSVLEKTVTEDNPVATFGDIEYDQAGTYEYTITERNDGVDGVTYDTTPHKVVVTVTKDPDTNKLSASVDYGEEEKLIIKNSFEAAKTHFEATKEFNDWGKAESFTFNLAPVTEGAPMPKETSAVATKDKSTAQWAELSFDKAGTYEYTITEVNDGADGVAYDTTPHKVVVTVEKGADNKLTASVKYDGKDSLTITNTYTSTSTELEATKQFNDWGKADSFTFKLAAVDGAPMPADAEDGIKTATATEDNVTAKFGEIKYEKAGTYEYTITEVDDGVDGVTYDTTPHKVVVTVSKDKDTNALSAEATYDGGKTLIITNTYASANATIQATKDFNDWGKAKSFTFNLAAKDGAPMPKDESGAEVTSATATEANPTAVFGKITYEKAGTYKYEITEVNDGVDGVTYDSKAHEVIVTVTKGDGNKLSTSVTYDGAASLTITNTYAGTKATLEATKEFNDWGKADSFTFDLAAIDDAPMPAKTEATATKDATTASFGEVEYEKAGTYEYTITEQNGGADGVTYDTTPHKAVVTVTKDENTNKLSASVKYDEKDNNLTITNTYAATKATIEATKKFDDWGKASEFKFDLAAVTDGAPMPETTTATATEKTPLASFGEITYEKTGVYEYTITEQNGGADGVTYDTTPHNVVVTVTKDKDTNKLSASVKYDEKDDSLTITNTYASTKATIKATKEFNDWGKAKNFTFNLAAVTKDAPMPDETSAKATEKDPLASFGQITYEKAGTYEYTITEVNDGVDGVTYDTTPHKVVVTVTKADDATNKLTASVKYDGADSLIVTNTYEATEATLEATKQFNDWGKAESFTFNLKAVTEGAPMPDNTEAVATKDQKTATFGTVQYEKAGIYEYTITEEKGDADGVTYDTTPHKVVVTVTKADDATNKLTATVKYDEKDALVITNTYASTKTTLQATKAFEDWGKAESFTFTLKAENNAPMPENETAVATKANPTAVFGEIEYEKAGTYSYTITEQNGGADGVSYDTTPHKVVVTVSKDKDNKLAAVAKYDEADSLIITNTYTCTKATIETTKDFNDWGKADSFTFNLAAVTEGAPMPASASAIATKQKPLASFGEIQYEKAGTYEYTLTEVNDGKDGVSYDTTPHKVVVTVSKADDATNALSAKVTYDGKDSLTITNTYTSTKATLEATKEFNDWGKADSFTFDLAAVSEGAPMPAKKTATATKADPLASFGEIEYEKAGTYEYTITERNGGADGVSYDTTPHKVVVTVTKAEDATNKLTAAVAYDGGKSLTVTNTYTATKATIEATKEFNDWGKADNFTFNLRAISEGAPMPEETTAIATENEKTASWGEITYEKAGTYEYEITEVNDGVDGVSYDITPHKVTVKVTKAEDATNKLSATVTYDGKTSLTITNKFTSVKAPIKVTKAFNDWGMAESFTFTLEAVTEDAPMPEKTVAKATKNAVDAMFGDIEYERAGTYEYTITETDDGEDGVQYDTTPHKVTVKVTKAEDATNKLSAEVTYDGKSDLIVTNIYESAKATLQTTKSFNDWGKAESFTFTLKGVDGAPMPKTFTAKATKDAPTAVFGEIEFKKSGTYKYTITEANDGVDGVSYDISEHQAVVTVVKGEKNKLIASVKYDDEDSLIVTNTYTSVKAPVEVTKSFKDWGKADSFTFTLKGVNGAPMPAKTKAFATKDDPTASFGEIEFEKSGTYEYTITEQNDGVDGVSYDTTPHKVVVTVTKAEDATNKLTAKVAYEGKDSLTVTNTYEGVKTNLKATKKINNWGKATYFVFNLKAVTEGAPMPAMSKATATKTAPTATFGDITFEKAGTYKYTITEQDEGVDGITYDTSAHQVTVTVTKAEDATNKLSAVVTYDGKSSLTITNKYAAKGSIQFKGKKTLKGKNLKAGDFEFEVTDEDDEVIQTVSNKADGTINFKTIKYTLDDVGTHTYTVSEVDPDDDHITCKTDDYTVTVKVKDNGDGTLKVTASSNYKKLNFVNEYKHDKKEKKKSKSSKTGDNTPLALYSGLGLLALLIAALEFIRRRRNRQNAE